MKKTAGKILRKLRIGTVAIWTFLRAFCDKLESQDDLIYALLASIIRIHFFFYLSKKDCYIP